MSRLQLTPEGHPFEDARSIPIDDPDEPMTEAGLRELELDRAADEGMIEPPGPEMDVPGPPTEPPGPEDEPRGPEIEVPGTEVPGPDGQPADAPVEAPGRDDRPAIVSAVSPAAGLSRAAWRAA
jgi:hypothetical protein